MGWEKGLIKVLAGSQLQYFMRISINVRSCSIHIMYFGSRLSECILEIVR